MQYSQENTYTEVFFLSFRRPATLWKRDSQYRRFPVNIAKLLRIAFLWSTSSGCFWWVRLWLFNRCYAFFFQHNNNLYYFYKFFEKLCFYLFQNCDGPQGTNAYQSVGLVTHYKKTNLFRTLSNIYDGIFWEIVNDKKTGKYFRKMFYQRCARPDPTYAFKRCQEFSSLIFDIFIIQKELNCSAIYDANFRQQFLSWQKRKVISWNLIHLWRSI